MCLLPRIDSTLEDAFTARIMAEITKAHSFMVAGISEMAKKLGRRIFVRKLCE